MTIGLTGDRFRSPLLTPPQPSPTLGIGEGSRQTVLRARILVVDDNPAILNHVTAMLQTDHQIIGTVIDEDSIFSEVEKLEPDLIVLDISMGARSGIEIARHLREEGYVGEIVFLTVHEDPDFVSAAIDVGGRGYVIKSRMNVDLKLAVDSALSHRMFVSPPLQDE
jgi:DNA-binding NarL/FixJ family response regulator